MNERARLLALWSLALLATLLVSVKGRGLSPSKATSTAFSYGGSNVVRIKVTGVYGKSGIYNFPQSVSLGGVINMAHSGGHLDTIGTVDLGRRLRDGEWVDFRSERGGSTEISVQMMSVDERMMLGVPLDPNALRALDWERLPGIGPALAARIVFDRQRNGAFHSLMDLERVRGIGPKTVDRIRRFF